MLFHQTVRRELRKRTSTFSHHQAKPLLLRCPARPRLSLLRPSRHETGHNPPSMVPFRPQPLPSNQHNLQGESSGDKAALCWSGSFEQEEPARQDPGKPATTHPPLHAQHRAKALYMPQCSPRRATLLPLRTERARSRRHTTYTFSLLRICQGSSQPLSAVAIGSGVMRLALTMQCNESQRRKTFCKGFVPRQLLTK